MCRLMTEEGIWIHSEFRCTAIRIVCSSAWIVSLLRLNQFFISIHNNSLANSIFTLFGQNMPCPILFSYITLCNILKKKT